MTNAQKPNKKVANKSCKATGRAGSRAKKKLNHGKGKNNHLVNKQGKKKK